MGHDVDLDRPVTDTVHLGSLPGVVDPLLQQCHDIGAPLLSGIRRAGDSVVLDLDGPLRAPAGIRLYSAFGLVLGSTDATGAVDALRRSARDGVLSAVTTGCGVRFRVDDIDRRGQLVEQVHAELGWVNDPHDWHVNLTTAGPLLLAQVGPLFRSRRFPAMARVAASANPLIAALLVRLLKIGHGDVVHDPFCGAATLLVEAAALDAGAVLSGSDVSAEALAQAADNRALFPGGLLFRADASRLPLARRSVDRIVTNMPFGKRVGSHADNLALYPAFLGEVTRVLALDGRAVLLTEEKTLLRASIEATAGTRLLREVKLATPGDELHPSAFVVERTRTARRGKRAS